MRFVQAGESGEQNQYHAQDPQEMSLAGMEAFVVEDNPTEGNPGQDGDGRSQNHAPGLLGPDRDCVIRNTGLMNPLSRSAVQLIACSANRAAIEKCSGT